MSWKIYSLGSYNNANNVGNNAKNKLTELGYTATWSYISALQGTLAVTVDGVVYSATLWIKTDTTCPFYLCVNDETNDILVTTNNGTMKGSQYFDYMVNWALLSGTNAQTGESGLFILARTYTFAYEFSNLWYYERDNSPVMFLHRALFAVDGKANTAAPFISNLYWGSAKLSNGATFTIGADNFVCLGGYLYAKL